MGRLSDSQFYTRIKSGDGPVRYLQYLHSRAYLLEEETRQSDYETSEAD